MSGRPAVGWDVGGAHLKWALIDADGALEGVRQLACPLWRGVHELDAALAILRPLCPAHARHVLTMTGELCDGFSTREEGVQAIVDSLRRQLPASDLSLYAWPGQRVSPTDYTPHTVASMNWHASARVLAQANLDALFIDLGSTTCDLIRLREGAVLTRGLTDRARLITDELVYQGVVRTPVMALARHVLHRGERQGVASELFATLADVYRLLGTLPEAADLYPTADGRDKTREASAARLARMVGEDYSPDELPVYVELAREFAACQREQLCAAILRVEALHGNPAPLLIGAGVGRDLVRELAGMLDREYLDFATALGFEGPWMEAACDHAPAVACAVLGSA